MLEIAARVTGTRGDDRPTPDGRLEHRLDRGANPTFVRLRREHTRNPETEIRHVRADRRCVVDSGEDVDEPRAALVREHANRDDLRVRCDPGDPDRAGRADHTRDRRSVTTDRVVTAVRGLRVFRDERHTQIGVHVRQVRMIEVDSGVHDGDTGSLAGGDLLCLRCVDRSVVPLAVTERAFRLGVLWLRFDRHVEVDRHVTRDGLHAAHAADLRLDSRRRPNAEHLVTDRSVHLESCLREPVACLDPFPVTTYSARPSLAVA